MPNVVDFAVHLTPSAKVEAKTRVEVPDEQGKPKLAHPGGAATLLRVLTMPHDERVAVLRAGADDPILVLFALLTKDERRQVIQAAEDFLKAKVTA